MYTDTLSFGNTYGLLKLKHGKGVIVRSDLAYPTDQSLVRRAQKLAPEALDQKSQRPGWLTRPLPVCFISSG